MQRADEVSAQDGFARGMRLVPSILLIDVNKGVQFWLKFLNTLQVVRDNFLRRDLFVPDALSQFHQRKVMKGRHVVPRTAIRA